MIYRALGVLTTAFLLGVIFFVVRRRIKSSEEETPGLNLGFTLADLRQMHAEGQMTDEEFEYAKRKMAARAKAEIKGIDPVEPRDPGAPAGGEPVIEDLGDISPPGVAPGSGPENSSETTRNTALDESSTTDSESDPDKDDGFDGVSGADPDKIDEP